ncbi:MAG: Hsp20/alpha crystallin family protein [Candidatus Lokiarchaeota archaeon]|nr:Hsp20/alpha crystallin family protein [Candidatus Lokiarchaeota archaeon]
MISKNFSFHHPYPTIELRKEVKKMCDDRHYGHRQMHGCFSFSPRDVARMKRMAHQFMGSFMGSYIHHNIEDLGDEYLITVPLPGRTKEDVTVSLINKHLNIKASKPKIPEHEKVKKEPEEQGFPFMFRGFTFIDVNMDVPLPADADENKISSKMVNGLLRVIIGKKPAKPIDISEEPNN